MFLNTVDNFMKATSLHQKEEISLKIVEQIQYHVRFKSRWQSTKNGISLIFPILTKIMTKILYFVIEDEHIDYKLVCVEICVMCQLW